MTANEINITYKPVHYGKVTSSSSAERILRSLWDENNMRIFEEFKVLYLNQGNRVIGMRTISQGGITSTAVDVRLILSIALKTLATGIVLAHNHPSGNLQPSHPDRRLTEKLKEAAKLLDIDIFDHLILTPASYFSFAEEGIL